MVKPNIGTFSASSYIYLHYRKQRKNLHDGKNNHKYLR